MSAFIDTEEAAMRCRPATRGAFPLSPEASARMAPSRTTELVQGERLSMVS
jgi:hypothetical protein